MIERSEYETLLLKYFGRLDLRYRTGDLIKEMLIWQRIESRSVLNVISIHEKYCLFVMLPDGLFFQWRSFLSYVDKLWVLVFDFSLPSGCFYFLCACCILFGFFTGLMQLVI